VARLQARKLASGEASAPPRNQFLPLPMDLRLSMTLRYLAGGSHLDICFLHGVSPKTFYPIVKETVKLLDVVLHNLNFKDVVNDRSERAAVARGFCERIAKHQGKGHSIIPGCIGAIDGIVFPIQCPKRIQDKHDRTQDVVDPLAYYCRKGLYGINVVAICDARYRFLYMSSHAPGSTHDSMAFRTADDGELHRLLSEGTCYDELRANNMHLNGDDAYAVSPTMAVPWTGDITAAKEAYNHHHSRARIAIEQSFGILCNRFLLLKRSWSGTLKMFNRIIGVCMKLHNFAIDGAVNFRERCIHTAQVEEALAFGAFTPDHLGERDPIAHNPYYRSNRTEGDMQWCRMNTANHTVGQPQPLRLSSADDHGEPPAWYGDEQSPRSMEYTRTKQPGFHNQSGAAELDFEPQTDQEKQKEHEGVCPARVQNTRYIKRNGLYARRVR